MYGVEEVLMKVLEDLSLCRVKNMKGNIKDDVLHILFDVSYSEINVTDKIMMNKNDINTNKKEAY